MPDPQRAGFRRTIWERDAGVCGFCREPVAFSEMELDHIKPRAVGGRTVAANLRPAHRECNRRNGWAEVKRYRRDLPDECEAPERRLAPVVHLALDPDIERRVRDFQFANRIPSKSAAYRWLVQAALRAGLRPA